MHATDLRLIPFPREIIIHADTFRLDQSLALYGPPDALDFAASLLNDEFQRAALPGLEITSRSGDSPEFILSSARSARPKTPDLSPPSGDEEYRLLIQPHAIHIAARTPAARLHGLHTLCQLLRANRRDQSLPCLEILDRPALRWRAFQDDITRGPSPRLATLQGEVALGAWFKLNVFTYYLEHQFAFRSHPLIGPRDGSLTPDELTALVAFAAPRHVAVLGNQQSLGHCEHILKHARYRHLAETRRILTPVRAETYALLDDLYREQLPLLPFPFFNVNCDETVGLGDGPAADLVRQRGVGAVYAGHMRRVHDLVTGRYGRRMLMWGDIILQHPDELHQIPRDTLMLTWAYDPADDYASQILPFARSGYEFLVCPGVNCWKRIVPDFAAATTNIRHFVRDGARHGALGMLNTSWDDDGENLNALNWPGFAWGAECAWNASVTEPADFNRRLGAVLFGEPGDHFGQAIDCFAAAHALPVFRGLPHSLFWRADPLADPDSATALGEIARTAHHHLEACQAAATANANLLEYFLFAAQRLEWLAERTFAGAAPEPAQRARLRENLVALAADFERLWLRENKPYALDWTATRYAAHLARLSSE